MRCGQCGVIGEMVTRRPMSLCGHNYYMVGRRRGEICCETKACITKAEALALWAAKNNCGAQRMPDLRAV
jgi:hypothetical protein